MGSHVSVTKRPASFLPWITTGIALYLLIFSTFALYHAYANDELINSHGCQIGEWVQHGQTATVAIVLLSITLVPFRSFTPTIQRTSPKLFRSTASLRGPPQPVLL
jgi:hypothetical protein